MVRRPFPVERCAWFFPGPLIGLTTVAFALLLIPRWSGAQSSATSPSDAALREQGRQVFTAQCGKCHDADAAKKLPDGSTLLERLAARQDPQAKLATRLKSMSEQDARGVSLYMEELIANFRAAQKTSAQK
jgi:mono/diheme cytochrome c family protein